MGQAVHLNVHPVHGMDWTHPLEVFFWSKCLPLTWRF